MENIKEAVILAAGEGRRLSKISKGMPKFMVNIAGKPLIYYTMSILQMIGVDRVNIVIQKKWKSVAEEILDSYISKIHVNYIENNHVEKDNGYSFLLARDFITDPEFLLLMSDHVFSIDFIKRFIKAVHIWLEKDKNTVMYIAGDKNPSFINISEATKIYADENNKIIKIGKNIDTFNFVDSGLFVIKKEFYNALDLENLLNREVIKFAEIIMSAINRSQTIKVVDVNEGYWTEIDTPSDYQDLVYGKRRIILEEIQKILQRREL